MLSPLTTLGVKAGLLQAAGGASVVVDCKVNPAALPHSVRTKLLSGREAIYPGEAAGGENLRLNRVTSSEGRPCGACCGHPLSAVFGDV